MSELLPLKECPPGLFWFGGTLGMKTEYSTESTSHPGCFQCDAYVVASGEYFWGGTSDPRERGKLMVTPIDDEAALAALATRPPAPAAGELAALAEAWVSAARSAVFDEWSPRDSAHDLDEAESAARAAFHTALSAHLAEVRAAIGPVAEAVADISEARSDWLNLFGFYTVKTRLTVGDLRRIAALAKKLEG